MKTLTHKLRVVFVFLFSSHFQIFHWLMNQKALRVLCMTFILHTFNLSQVAMMH
jgi:hypothetical protein